MKYSEKLKDPRWQKKRLQIFDRDVWTCQTCLCTAKTLCVHHIKYEPGKEPWDVPDEYLMTLCEECHELERDTYPEHIKYITDILYDSLFTSNDLLALADFGGSLLNKYGKDECLRIIFRLATGDNRK
jgi:hypothetical protein